MLQIKNTLGGGKPEGLYAWKKSEIGSELKEFNESVSTLPYAFYNGSAVVLNGEIHILGGMDNSTKHYKWNGTSWTSVSSLPIQFYHGSAVVLNNEIHILGGYATQAATKHYKWDGSSWTSVSTLPYSFYHGSAVVFNGEIHILGGDSTSAAQTSHYKWDGSSWTKVSTLPYKFYSNSAVVLNNEIHILGSSATSPYTQHYKWNGVSWTSVSTLPYNFNDGSAVVLNNEIHILGCYESSARNSHYKLNGSSWVSVGSLPIPFYRGEAVVYNNAIHILGSGSSNYQTAHYSVCGYILTYTFLDYIVSDKETAYPDGGEKGGYYYEKVGSGLTPEMFGCTKMAVDKYTFASKSALNVPIPHSLGEIPKYLFIFSEVNDPTSDSSNYLVRYWGAMPKSSKSTMVGFKDYRSSNDWGNTTESFYNTDTQIVSNKSYDYWLTGEEYTVLTMA